MRKAPYLTVAGEPINVGEKYFTVNSTSGVITEHIAGGENNVIYNFYTKHYHEAAYLSNMIQLHEKMSAFIADLKNRALGK